MRLARLALVLLVVVAFGGLVYGAAANIGVGSDDVGVGGDTVAACDTDGVTVSWGPLVYVPSLAAFKITTVTLDGIAQPECEDANLRFQLTTTGGAALGPLKTVNGISSLTTFGFSYTANNIKAEDVLDAHIAIYGP